jgi:hypothetical protein
MPTNRSEVAWFFREQIKNAERMNMDFGYQENHYARSIISRSRNILCGMFSSVDIGSFPRYDEDVISDFEGFSDFDSCGSCPLRIPGCTRFKAIRELIGAQLEYYNRYRRVVNTDEPRTVEEKAARKKLIEKYKVYGELLKKIWELIKPLSYKRFTKAGFIPFEELESLL